MSGGFQPDELDRLEDALERLDDPGPTQALLEALEFDGELGARFAAYRDLNELLRAQLPLESPPAGAVARAVEMARSEAASGSEPAPLDADGDDRPGASGWERFWRGLRSAGLPLATLAGTAALVLWIVRPEGVMSEARIASGEGPARSLGAVAEPTTGSGSGSADRPAAAQPRIAEEAAAAKTDAEADLVSQADDELAERAQTATAERKKEAPGSSAAPSTRPKPATGGYTSPDRAARASGAASADPPPLDGVGERSGGGGEGLDPEASGNELGEEDAQRAAEEGLEADPKAQRYARLEASHRLRRQGNCGGAIGRYEQLLAEPDLDALQIARAEGGLGLCRELLGDRGVAERHFARARALDPGIGGWLDAERARTPAAAAEAPARRKAKTARPSAYEQP